MIIKRCETVLKPSLRFSSSIDINERTIKLADTFGIDLDNHEFILYDNISIEILRRDIVYITGESGGGKSQLLRFIVNELDKNEFGRIITEQDILDSINERPIIEQIGNDVDSAIRILSIVGLNEAYLMLKRYNELSEGQKYRFRIAKMIDSNADTLVIDEFLSLLDRTTAKVVAYTIQRTIRKLNKTLIVATAHNDLIDDLNPDLLIIKNFGNEVYVKRRVVSNHECSILKDLKISEGSIDDYNKLKEFHYKRGKVIPLYIYKATINDELAGVIVYGPAHLSLKARNIVLPQYKVSNFNNRKEHAKCINNNIIRIWRVIVKPKFRGAGLATKLIKETLRLVNYPYVEALAVMAQYSHFFESAGFTKVDPKLYNNVDKAYLKALNKLITLGFDLNMLVSKRYCKGILQSLNPKELEEVKEIIIKHFYSEKFKHPRSLKELINGDIDALAEALTNRKLPCVYLIWKNPNIYQKDICG